MQYLQILVLVACAAFAGALPHHLAKRQSFHGFNFEDENGDSKSGLFPPGFPFHHNRDRDFFNPFFSVSEDDGDRKDPFSGFGSLFELFEAQLRRMQEEIDDLNKRIDSSGPGSTSNTTVIDGHVVTVNETTHKSNDTDNPFFYHVKVINIRPSESPEQDEVFPVDDTSYTPEGEQTPEPYNPFRGDEVSHNDEENEIPQLFPSHEDWRMLPSNYKPEEDDLSNDIYSAERLSDDVEVNERLNKIAKGVGYLPVDPEVEVLRDEDGDHVDLFPNQVKKVPVVYDVIKG